MKKIYNNIEIEIYMYASEDVIRTSPNGEVDGDETKYPIPEDWAN